LEKAQLKTFMCKQTKDAGLQANKRKRQEADESEKPTPKRTKAKKKKQSIPKFQPQPIVEEPIDPADDLFLTNEELHQFVQAAAAAAAAAASTTNQPKQPTKDEDGDVEMKHEEAEAKEEDEQKTREFKAVKEPACRSIRYRLHPTKGLMELLRKAFGVATWTYNQCLNGIKKKIIPPQQQACRDYAIKKSSDLIQQNPWAMDVPFDIRDEAAKDLVTAYKAHETKVAKGDLRAAKAEFKFQKKYRKSKKLVINSQFYKSAGVFFPAYFGKTPFRCNEKLPDKIHYAANLTINWLGQVHLHIPQPLDKKNVAPAPFPVAAIDPGVRTFGTVFDPHSNLYIEWGQGDMTKLSKIGWTMDRLKSKMDAGGDKNVGHRKRYRMRRTFRRLAYRIQNMVKDFHYRFAHWLCQNYQVILLPFYQVSQMVIRHHRKIRSKTVRGMLTWSPCLFRDRLMGVARRYPDCHVVQLSEAYTTQTCRCCGQLNKKVGGAKIFNCTPCGARYGRDFGGSSGVLLRYLTRLKQIQDASER